MCQIAKQLILDYEGTSRWKGLDSAMISILGICATCHFVLTYHTHTHTHTHVHASQCDVHFPRWRWVSHFLSFLPEMVQVTPLRRPEEGMAGLCQDVRRFSLCREDAQVWHEWMKKIEVVRMYYDTDAKMILMALPPDSWERPPGRPRITWLNTVQWDLRAYNLTLNEAVDLAQNCPLWRLVSVYGITHS